MSLRIDGLGTAVPAERLDQVEAGEIAKLFVGEEGAGDRGRVVAALYRRSGVKSRHSVLAGPGRSEIAAGDAFFRPAVAADDRGPSTSDRMGRYEAEAAPLAARAAAQALERAGEAPGAITHLVTVSCSGFSAPGFDVAMIKRLGLDPEVARSHIGFMGCHGALNGLRVARSFVEADPEARVLLAAVELCTLHLHYGWDPEKIVANSLFADGAAALVGRSGEDGAPPSGAPGAARGAGQGGGWRVLANGSTLLPDCEEAMTWKVGDHGFEMGLSPRVPAMIESSVRPWLERWLGRHDLTMDGVASWAVHPGGPRILAAFAQGAGLPREALAVSYEVLERYGNMSSPTVLFILDRLRELAAPRPAVALGFGPGLAVEAALLD